VPADGSEVNARSSGYVVSDEERNSLTMNGDVTEMRNSWWAVPAAAGAVVMIAACGSSAAGGSGAPSTTPQAQATAPASTSAPATTAGRSVVIATRSTKIGTVLTNAQGRTLYWFAIDTPAKSNCNGTCASYWPPVLGKATAAAGASLPKGFGTITRSDGQVQATYDGHPLYTYAADTSAGMTSGNGLKLSGALWWAMTPSGAKPAAAGPSTSSSSGGGYGY
jgi:predicted lipoprotein with Yx(FWY)xxD motif